MKKHLVSLFFIFLFVASFCFGGAETVVSEKPVAPLSAVTSNKSYAAIVNGEQITLEEFNTSLKNAQQTLEQRDHIDFETEEGKFILATTKKSIIDDMINNRLINQQANNMEITVSEEDIQERIVNIKKGFPSHDSFLETLAEEGISEEDLRQGMKEQTVIQKIKNELTQKVIVSDKEIDRFIKQHREFSNTKRQYHLAQIITATKEEANRLLGKIEKGEEFEKLATKYSLDVNSRDAGGDIGFVEEGSLDQATEEALKELSIGVVSDIVFTEKGYIIYKCLGIIDPQVEETTQKKEEAVKFLKAKKENEMFEKWFKKIRRDAVIEINNDVIPPLQEMPTDQNNSIPGSTLSNAEA